MQQLIEEAIQSLKYCSVDFDKIAKVCDSRDVDLAHVQVMAENGRDMAGKAHNRIKEILEKVQARQANDGVVAHNGSTNSTGGASTSHHGQT